MSTYRPKHFPLPNGYRFPGSKEPNADPYLFSEDIAITVDVALATNRPLLVSGPPGCGKTRLAEAVAALLGWNYLAKTLTSRTRLEELTVEVDYLSRLNDAQRRKDTEKLKADETYHKPGIFWWAFDAPLAAARLLGTTKEKVSIPDCQATFPGVWRAQESSTLNCVLLLDEIDKAEPDLPNDLLEPLDRRSFGLPDGSTLVGRKEQRLLTFITTNGERVLPQAFLRRCVFLRLQHPDQMGLINIAKEHLPNADLTRVRAIAEKMIAMRKVALDQNQRPPGTSEFLDAVVACESLRAEVNKPVWEYIERAVLLKRSEPNAQ